MTISSVYALKLKEKAYNKSAVRIRMRESKKLVSIVNEMKMEE